MVAVAINVKFTKQPETWNLKPETFTESIFPGNLFGAYGKTLNFKL